MKKLLLTLILIPGMVLANGWNVGYTNIKDSEISVGALSGSLSGIMIITGLQSLV